VRFTSIAAGFFVRGRDSGCTSRERRYTRVVASFKLAFLTVVLAHSTCTFHHDHHDDDHHHHGHVTFSSSPQTTAQLMSVRILDLDGDGMLDVAAPHRWWIAGATGWQPADAAEMWDSIVARAPAGSPAVVPPFAGWDADALRATEAWLYDDDADGVIDRIVPAAS